MYEHITRVCRTTFFINVTDSIHRGYKRMTFSYNKGMIRQTNFVTILINIGDCNDAAAKSSFTPALSSIDRTNTDLDPNSSQTSNKSFMNDFANIQSGFFLRNEISGRTSFTWTVWIWRFLSGESDLFGNNLKWVEDQLKLNPRRVRSLCKSSNVFTEQRYSQWRRSLAAEEASKTLTIVDNSSGW